MKQTLNTLYADKTTRVLCDDNYKEMVRKVFAKRGLNIKPNDKLCTILSWKYPVEFPKDLERDLRLYGIYSIINTIALDMHVENDY